MTTNILLSKEYGQVLEEIKRKIVQSQTKAALAINQELIKLYWEIGKTVFQKQHQEGWGAKVIETLSRDLKKIFPDLKGFSKTNISYMVQFAKEYPSYEIIQQLVGQIPWGHNLLIISKLESKQERVWYIKKTIENGWSRAMLSHWIDCKLYQREGRAITNFEAVLPPPRSDLAKQMLKDPFCFDFLTLRKDYEEKELEEGLVKHIQEFLLELGQGFAFVGRQYKLTIDDNEYAIDLLFYHLKLRCYCVIELKAVDFQPEFKGKLNFYLAAVDDLVKHSEDNPTIGILICKGKSTSKVKYALRGVSSPMGISSFETVIMRSLPENLHSSLPTVEELEAEIERSEGEPK